MRDNPAGLAAHLIELEQLLLHPDTRRDPAALASLLTEDFHGRWPSLRRSFESFCPSGRIR